MRNAWKNARLATGHHARRQEGPLIIAPGSVRSGVQMSQVTPSNLASNGLGVGIWMRPVDDRPADVGLGQPGGRRRLGGDFTGMVIQTTTTTASVFFRREKRRWKRRAEMQVPLNVDGTRARRPRTRRSVLRRLQPVRRGYTHYRHDRHHGLVSRRRAAGSYTACASIIELYGSNQPPNVAARARVRLKTRQLASKKRCADALRAQSHERLPQNVAGRPQSSHGSPDTQHASTQRHQHHGAR